MQVYSFHGLRLSERRLAKPAMTVAACTTYAIGCSNHGHGGGRKEASQRRAIAVGRTRLGTIRAITISRSRSSTGLSVGSQGLCLRVLRSCRLLTVGILARWGVTPRRVCA